MNKGGPNGGSIEGVSEDMSAGAFFLDAFEWAYHGLYPERQRPNTLARLLPIGGTVGAQ